MFPTLLSPLDHGRLQLPNRVVFPGHQTLYSRDGAISDRLREYYLERARGGVGAVVVEGGAIHPTTLKFPDYLRLYDEDVVGSVAHLARGLHELGTRVFVQLAHSGSRMGSMDSREPLWAPSDVRSGNAVEVPHAMDRRDMEELLDGYRTSAALMARAGVDGVEVHAAHEYLLGEFLSPHNNRRDDEYGGSRTNRVRFPLEVVQTVREAVGDDLVVGVRLNGSDRSDAGNDVDDYVEFARLIDASGAVDYLSISAGTSTDNSDIVPPMDVPEGINVPEAAAIHDVVSAAVFAVGRIKRPAHAEQVLATGKADAIAMARALIADPQFVHKAAAQQPERIRPCVGANSGCYGRLTQVRPISCVVNPAVGLERDLGEETVHPAKSSRRVVVVGGGPAGLEAARMAATRGHDVVVLEAADELGGQLRLASAVDSRRELWELVEFQRRELERLEVEVRLTTTVDAAMLGRMPASAVVLATGSRARSITLERDPVAPPVVGVADAIDRARSEASGEQVVVIDDVGHMQAYVPAELFADAGAEVRIVTPAAGIGRALDETTLARLSRRLASKGVAITAGAETMHLGVEGLLVRISRTGDQMLLPASLVVAALPNRVHAPVALGSLPSSLEVHQVGDVVAPRTALEAVRDGHRVGRHL